MAAKRRARFINQQTRRTPSLKTGPVMSPHKAGCQSNEDEALPPEEYALRHRPLRHSDFVDLGEVVRQEVLDAALLLRLLLQRFQVLQQ